MFGIGFPELILILALALIVVGPDKLPELARSVAKTLVDLKKTAEGLKDSFNEEDNPIADIKPQLEDAAKNFKETILDDETKTWKNSKDFSDLQSVIDDTTHVHEDNQDNTDTQDDQSPAPDPGDAQDAQDEQKNAHDASTSNTGDKF
ncbi:MAG: Sec-independent protein translocase protein TatB [Desulfopila sp.]